MIARRLASTVVTAPMAFIGFGWLLAQTGWMPAVGAERALHLVVPGLLLWGAGDGRGETRGCDGRGAETGGAGAGGGDHGGGSDLSSGEISATPRPTRYPTFHTVRMSAGWSGSSSPGAEPHEVGAVAGAGRRTGRVGEVSDRDALIGEPLRWLGGARRSVTVAPPAGQRPPLPGLALLLCGG